MNIYKIAMISEELNELLREKELMQELIEEKGDKLSQQEIDNMLSKLKRIKRRMVKLNEEILSMKTDYAKKTTSFMEEN